MARYRSILQAAVALVLFLPAARPADAQDMLVIDSGGARWRSGENRKPTVTVDLGIIGTLSADRRPTAAARRQHLRPRRYLTLIIPQPDAPSAPLSLGRPAPTAAPAAEPPPAADPAAEAPSETQTPPDRAEALEAGEQPVEPDKPAVSPPPDRTVAVPARRLPAGKADATPALRAFLDQAAGKQPAVAPPDALPSAKPARAKLPPPPRPIIEARLTESNGTDGASLKTGTAARFGLPPPAPVTGRTAPSSAPAARLPPPPPATGTPGDLALPPPVESKAGVPVTPRRQLTLDVARQPPAAASVAAGVHSETFFYEAGGATLDADGRERLRSLAGKMTGEYGLGVEIRAFSGPLGGDDVAARRTALSRAMEVRRLLISAGVPEARILARAVGVGDHPVGRVDVILVTRS